VKLFVGAAACVVSLVAFGCRSITGNEGGSVVATTDRSSYDAQYLGSAPDVTYGFTVVARLENHGSKSVSLNTCGSSVFFNVEVADGSAARLSAYDPRWICLAIASVIELKPGSAHEESIFLPGRNGTGGSGTSAAALSGPMRMAYSVTTCTVGCSGIIVRSNVFNVTLRQLAQ